jgi:hypothetical protein
MTSHPDFVGAGETHTTYQTPADLPKLVPRTGQLLRKVHVSGKYILDKLTMDQYLQREEILLSPQIHKCVIVVRAPEAALKSLMNLFGFDEKTALGVYVSRLETLVRYSSILRERAFLLEYDRLLAQTNETLAALTKFFGIERPFTATYQTHKATGKMGDPSSHIFAGRIIHTPRHNIQISADVMAEAQQAFEARGRELLVSGMVSAAI